MLQKSRVWGFARHSHALVPANEQGLESPAGRETEFERVALSARTGRLTLEVDPFGMGSLFFILSDDWVLVSTSIWGLVAHSPAPLSLASKEQLKANHGIPFASVRSVRPLTTVTLEATGASIVSVVEPADVAPPREEGGIARARKAGLDALAWRLERKQSVQVLLSGGIDSSAVLAAASQVYPRKKMLARYFRSSGAPREREERMARSMAEASGVRFIVTDLPNDAHCTDNETSYFGANPWLGWWQFVQRLVAADADLALMGGHTEALGSLSAAQALFSRAASARDALRAFIGRWATGRRYSLLNPLAGAGVEVATLFEGRESYRALCSLPAPWFVRKAGIRTMFREQMPLSVLIAPKIPAASFHQTPTPLDAESFAAYRLASADRAQRAIRQEPVSPSFGSVSLPGLPAVAPSATR